MGVRAPPRSPLERNIMTREQALIIANDAKTMELGELIAAYTEFQTQVNKTPNHIPGKDKRYQNALHAAMGMVTEASELLDPFKKNLYGKQKAIDWANLRDESGDMFYYLNAFLTATGFSLHEVIEDNVIKLANRYAENFN